MDEAMEHAIEIARELILDGPPLTRSGCCFHCDQPVAVSTVQGRRQHASYCFWAQLADALAPRARTPASLRD